MNAPVTGLHHVAFRVAGDAAERAMQTRLGEAGYQVSAVRDRSYFRSIYFRERNGILFEIATDTPGFAHDEPVASLGSVLRLPAQFEPFRAGITAALPELRPAPEARAPAMGQGERSGGAVKAAGNMRS